MTSRSGFCSDGIKNFLLHHVIVKLSIDIREFKIQNLKFKICKGLY